MAGRARKAGRSGLGRELKERRRLELAELAKRHDLGTGRGLAEAALMLARRRCARNMEAMGCADGVLTKVLLCSDLAGFIHGVDSAVYLMAANRGITISDADSKRLAHSVNGLRLALRQLSGADEVYECMEDIGTLENLRAAAKTFKEPESLGGLPSGLLDDIRAARFRQLKGMERRLWKAYGILRARDMYAGGRAAGISRAVVREYLDREYVDHGQKA